MPSRIAQIYVVAVCDALAGVTEPELDQPFRCSLLAKVGRTETAERVRNFLYFGDHEHTNSRGTQLELLTLGRREPLWEDGGVSRRSATTEQLDQLKYIDKLV